MNFYVYNEDVPLGQESLGTFGRTIIRDLKTLKGVLNRVRSWNDYKVFRVYSFTNFYDDNTFKLLHIENNNYDAKDMEDFGNHAGTYSD